MPALPRVGAGAPVCPLQPPGQIRRQGARSLGALLGQDTSEPAPGSRLQAQLWPSHGSVLTCDALTGEGSSRRVHRSASSTRPASGTAPSVLVSACSRERTCGLRPCRLGHPQHAEMPLRIRRRPVHKPRELAPLQPALRAWVGGTGNVSLRRCPNNKISRSKASGTGPRVGIWLPCASWAFPCSLGVAPSLHLGCLCRASAPDHARSRFASASAPTPGRRPNLCPRCTYSNVPPGERHRPPHAHDAPAPHLERVLCGREFPGRMARVLRARGQPGSVPRCWLSDLIPAPLCGLNMDSVPTAGADAAGE